MSRSAKDLLNQDFDSDDEDEDFNPGAAEDSDEEHERDDDAPSSDQRDGDSQLDRRRFLREGDGSDEKKKRQGNVRGWLEGDHAQRGTDPDHEDVGRAGRDYREDIEEGDEEGGDEEDDEDEDSVSVSRRSKRPKTWLIILSTFANTDAG